MSIRNCNPTKLGIVLRLLIAFLLISLGLFYENYVVVFIGCIPIVRLTYYFIKL